MFKRIVFAAALVTACGGNSSLATEDAVSQVGPFNAPENLMVFARAEGPATRVTPLQIACFFEHQAHGDKLSGGTQMFDDKMGGRIKKLRDSGEFAGHELETLMLIPPEGTVPAAKLLLIGLGDPNTFTAERMRSVGRVAVREALKLGVEEFSFSPNVTDAGVTKAKVGDFDTQVVSGVIEGFKIQRVLAGESMAPKVVLKQFTLEAGKANLPAAAEAITEAIKQANK